MKNQYDIRVRKNTGEVVVFDTEKLKNALRRSGATEKDLSLILGQMDGLIYDGITTRKIYQIAYSLLYKKSYRAAGRFRLKKSLYQMGPSGYPFEHFIARLLEFEGYEVKTGQIVQGKCVQHEVDVLAIKEGKVIMGECKFHQSDNAKTDVKVSLYVHSRFLDIKEEWLTKPENQDTRFEPLLITNTRFTEDAVQYGTCAGMTLISWDYPQVNSLKNWIDRSGFHPITSLKSLTNQDKKKLLDKGIVLCREIVSDPGLVADLRIPPRRMKNLIKEATALISD